MLEAENRLRAAGLWPVVEDVAKQYRLHPQVVVSRQRTRTIAQARHHLWAVLRWTLAFSLSELGRLFNVDHSTVLEGIRRHESRCGDDEPDEHGEAAE